LLNLVLETGQRKAFFDMNFFHELVILIIRRLTVYWMENLTWAIRYVENNLTNEISVEDVSKTACSSISNFQCVFNLVTGITIGDYIRNRRLTLAGQELLHKKSKIIDVAMRYQYDKPESF